MGPGNHEDIGSERIYAVAKSSPPLLLSFHASSFLAIAIYGLPCAALTMPSDRLRHG